MNCFSVNLLVLVLITWQQLTAAVNLQLLAYIHIKHLLNITCNYSSYYKRFLILQNAVIAKSSRKIVEQSAFCVLSAFL